MGAKVALQIESRHATQLHIEHETMRLPRRWSRQERFGGTVGGRVVAGGAEHSTERLQHRDIVVDDYDQRSVRHYRATATLGWCGGLRDSVLVLRVLVCRNGEPDRR